MADKKISQLNDLSPATGVDLFAIVDVLGNETKKITVATLMGTPGPIGSGDASTGRFLSLQLPSGAVINEFSIDGTLAGNSDSAVPSEKAVKTYVDAIRRVGIQSLSYNDNTADVVFSPSEANTNYVISTQLVNVTDAPPSIYSCTVVNKTINGFSVEFSGVIDSNNYTLEWSILRI